MRKRNISPVALAWGVLLLIACQTANADTTPLTLTLGKPCSAVENTGNPQMCVLTFKNVLSVDVTLGSSFSLSGIQSCSDKPCDDLAVPISISPAFPKTIAAGKTFDTTLKWDAIDTSGKNDHDTGTNDVLFSGNVTFGMGQSMIVSLTAPLMVVDPAPEPSYFVMIALALCAMAVVRGAARRGISPAGRHQGV